MGLKNHTTSQDKKKNHATSQEEEKIKHPLVTKNITQHLGTTTNNRATSWDKKFTQTFQDKKNHATS